MFLKRGVLGEFDPLLLACSRGESACFFSTPLEESGIKVDAWTEVGVPRERTARDAAISGGGCSGNVSLSRSHSNLMPAL